MHAVHKASPLRVAPICPHAHECSGCTLQHIDAGEQIYLKQNVMIDTLAQVAQVQPETVLPPIMGASSGFRRKMRFSVQGRLSKPTSDGVEALGLRVGTHAKFRRGIIDISHCSIVDPRFSIVALRALLTTLDLRDRLRCVHVAAADNALAIVLEASMDSSGPADLERLREFAAGAYV
jgi:23S rRNA (uracil1939-C5)-methyltransferase